MPKLLAFLTLVMANLAIPMASHAVTITMEIEQRYRFADTPGNVPYGVLIQFHHDGSVTEYEPDPNCYIRSNFLEECPRSGRGAYELDLGWLDMHIPATTVTVMEPAEGGGDCDLSEAEALQTWMEYFFLSWGMLIPIFFAAYAIGVLSKVIRGSR